MTDEVGLTISCGGFEPFLDGFYDAGQQLRDYVYRRTAEALSDSHARNDRISTPDEVVRRQAEIRATALAALGGLPAGGKFDAETTGIVKADHFDIEKVIFSSLPDYFVTGNLYVPHDLTQPTPAVVFVCGHADEAKADPSYQAVCARLARNGIIAFAIDPIGQGERWSYLDQNGRATIPPGTDDHSQAGTQCWWLGHSIARYFLHDIRSAVDYLESRPEVDPARLGITGASGGGTQTTLAMMLEPRFAAAAPGTFVMTRQDYLLTGQAQDAEQILPGAEGLDHEDFLIAMAPRPVLVLAANYDFFPIEGAVASVDRARRIYGILGAGENISLARVDSLHQYHPYLADKAVEFFVRHLRTDPAEQVHDETPPVLSARALACTRSGQLLTDRPEAKRVFDLNLAELAAMPVPSLADSREWLDSTVTTGRRPLAEFFPRWLDRTPEGSPVRIRHAFWWSEEGVFNAGVLFSADATGPVVVAVFERGTGELADRKEWIGSRISLGERVFVLDIRGTGSLAPHPINPLGIDEHYGTIYKLLTDLLWLGDSLAAGRVFDVMRATEFVRADPVLAPGDHPVRIYGTGAGGYYGALAAVLDNVEFDWGERGPDPTVALTQRYYDPQCAWWQLLPGGARHIETLLRAGCRLP